MTSSNIQPLALKDIDGIRNITSLEKFTISYATNLKTLPNLSALTNLTTLKINYCSLNKVSNESNLRSLTKLNSLDLANNNISNIEGLKIENENDFKSLEGLSLANNCLYNKNSYTDTSTLEYSIATDILVPLNNLNIESGRLRFEEIVFS